MLAGCGDDQPANDADATQARGFANVEQAEETPAPLVADTEAPEGNEADAIYLEWVHGQIETLGETSQITDASDEQLIAAGHEACGQLDAGTAYEDVRVVDGETAHPVNGAYYSSSAIMNGAILAYCEEHNATN